MNDIYIIMYQLNSPGQDYQKLYEKLKKFDYCKCMNSVWLVYTSWNTEEIYDYLSDRLDRNDYIFISNLGNNRYGYLSGDVWYWTKDRKARQKIG